MNKHASAGTTIWITPGVYDMQSYVPVA